MSYEALKSKISWSNENSTKELLRKFLKLFEPPERIKCSEWAPKHRRLSPESSSKAGKFSFDCAPWQKEVLDEPDNPETGAMILMWASQVTGKTETVNNIVGYTIDIDPCPMLVLQPTLDMGETWSKDRLATMLRDTPRLRGKVKDARTRDSGNTILHKRFPGGHITIAGANSPASLASRPIRKVICDEEDRYPLSAGTEGDPVSLAEKRTESFSDAVIIEISTPTIKGVSRIEKRFEQSDKRHWFVTHGCGHEFYFQWAHVKWEEGNPVGAWIECPNCKAHIFDAERQAMVRAGTWKGTAPFNGVRGYHLNGINCLFKAKKPFKHRLHQMVVQFLQAKDKGTEALKVWTNTFLAETWSDQLDEKPDWETVMDRCEDYGGGDEKNPIIPNPVCLLVCGVDVQHDRLEATVIGYGMNEETWAIEHKVLYGDVQKPEVWKDLDDAINRKYEHENGSQLKISICVIDTSDGKTQKMAYAFIKPRQGLRVYAIKGSSQANKPIFDGRAKLQKKHGINLFSIGTDTAKATTYARLRLPDAGPRYMHYPNGFGFTAEYFKQLVSETCRTVYKKGIPTREWSPDGHQRNEALDIRVYVLAAYEILNPNMASLLKLLERNAVKPQPEAKEYILKPEQPQPEKKPISKPVRPMRSGGWVSNWRR